MSEPTKIIPFTGFQYRKPDVTAFPKLRREQARPVLAPGSAVPGFSIPPLAGK